MTSEFLRNALMGYLGLVVITTLVYFAVAGLLRLAGCIILTPIDAVFGTFFYDKLFRSPASQEESR